MLDIHTLLSAILVFMLGLLSRQMKQSDREAKKRRDEMLCKMSALEEKLDEFLSET